MQMGEVAWGQCDELYPQRLQRVRVPFALAFARPGLSFSAGCSGGVGVPQNVAGALPLWSPRGTTPRVWPWHRISLNGIALPICSSDTRLTIPPPDRLRHIPLVSHGCAPAFPGSYVSE